MLFSRCHVLQGYFALLNLIVTSQSYESYMLGIGIVHLLLHLCLVREHLRTNACTSCFSHDGHTIGSLLITKVDEEQLCTVNRLLWIEIERIEHIINTVSTEA